MCDIVCEVRCEICYDFDYELLHALCSEVGCESLCKFDYVDQHVLENTVCILERNMLRSRVCKGLQIAAQDGHVTQSV